MIFSYAWRSKLRNVEAWVAVRLHPGPNLLEHTVKKGEAFRNIVAWIVVVGLSAVIIGD